MPTFVVPLTIEQAWDCFLGDDAPYFISHQIEEGGDKVNKVGNWGPPTEVRFESAFGK